MEPRIKWSSTAHPCPGIIHWHSWRRNFLSWLNHSFRHKILIDRPRGRILLLTQVLLSDNWDSLSLDLKNPERAEVPSRTILPITFKVSALVVFIPCSSNLLNDLSQLIKTARNKHTSFFQGLILCNSSFRSLVCTSPCVAKLHLQTTEMTSVRNASCLPVKQYTTEQETGRRNTSDCIICLIWPSRTLGCNCT